MRNLVRNQQYFVCGWAVYLLLVLTGCRYSSQLGSTRATELLGSHSLVSAAASTELPTPLTSAEQEFSQGEALLATSDCEATAKFFQAALLAWQFERNTHDADEALRKQAINIYNKSLRRLMDSAQAFDQLDEEEGLTLATSDGMIRVPIHYQGFAWQPSDFNQWLPVDDYEDKRLTRKHQRSGWGIPMVILRKRDADERFMSRTTPFAATVVLRNSTTTSIANSGEAAPAVSPVLEVFNPLTAKTFTDDRGENLALAADLSAPVAWLGNNSPHLNFDAFLKPDRMLENGQLIMLEPYQRGKIPLILVHGLASDVLTWNGLVNELRASDWFNEHYQIWFFAYSTGRPFLRSAADMRRECNAAIAASTRDSADPALERAVLIGHSMGGLVSKLQVTRSHDLLWSAFATEPLESLQTDPLTHEYLTELFYFEPLPFVKRAVFIGTPHGGSPVANEWVGRLASRLVVRAHDFSDEYNMFLERNRDAINPFFAIRIPTSVDMLEPKDPALQAMRQLPVARQVRLHSVIGNGRRMLIGGPADGTVPVESARHAGTDSELVVPTTHRRLQSHPETVEEVFRILELHLQEPPDRAPLIADSDQISAQNR